MQLVFVECLCLDLLCCKSSFLLSLGIPLLVLCLGGAGAAALAIMFSVHPLLAVGLSWVTHPFLSLFLGQDTIGIDV